MSEQMIPLSAIRPPEWNSRIALPKLDESVTGLAMSMASEGQLNAINVEGPDDSGMFDLVAGSRRCLAAVTLGWTEIRANVEPSTDSPTRIIKNIIENQQRKDLSLYEQARACSKLRDEKLSLKEIAEKTGISPGYVSNLVNMFNKLPTLVLKAWEDKQEPATFDFLRDLTTVVKEAKTPQAGAEVALQQWTDRVELYKDFNESLTPDEESDPEETEDEKKKKKKVKKNGALKVDLDLYSGLHDALKKSRLPGSALAIQAIKVMAGELDKIKGVYPLASDEPTTKDKTK